MTKTGSWCLRNTHSSGEDRFVHNEPGSQVTDSIKEGQSIILQIVMNRDGFPGRRVFQAGLYR